MGSRNLSLLFLDHGTGSCWGVSVTPRPFFTFGQDPVPIVQVPGWTPSLVWPGAENFPLHRVSNPGHSCPQPVSIHTTLLGPTVTYILEQIRNSVGGGNCQSGWVRWMGDGQSCVKCTAVIRVPFVFTKLVARLWIHKKLYKIKISKPKFVELGVDKTVGFRTNRRNFKKGFSLASLCRR